jgi:hypothetical protein
MNCVDEPFLRWDKMVLVLPDWLGHGVQFFNVPILRRFSLIMCVSLYISA